MKQMILIQHKILPMRTAQEQFKLAGVDTQLVVTDKERGIVYITAGHITGGGAAIMTESEWQSYLLLCDIWLNSPVDTEGAGAQILPRSHFERAFTEVEALLLSHARCIKEDEREEILRSLAGKLLPLKEAVLRAEEIWREERFSMKPGTPDARATPAKDSARLEWLASRSEITCCVDYETGLFGIYEMQGNINDRRLVWLVAEENESLRAAIDAAMAMEKKGGASA